jgi:hypothetical protein
MFCHFLFPDVKTPVAMSRHSTEEYLTEIVDNNKKEIKPREYKLGDI